MIPIDIYIGSICYLFIIYSLNSNGFGLSLIACIRPVKSQNKHPIRVKGRWQREVVYNHRI